MNVFEKRVKECRKKRLPDILENCSEDHALFLFKELLDEAKEKKEPVKIISGNLKDEFYNKLVREVENLPEEASVRLTVLKNRNFSENNFIKTVAGKKNGHVLVAKDGESLQNDIFHLVLVGDKKFRVETDHDKATALASFNSPNFGEILQSESEPFFVVGEKLEPFSIPS